MSVEDVPEDASAVRQWLSSPHVYFLGAHTGCSCGFPHTVMVEEPTEYFEELFFPDDDPQRQDDLRSAEALVRLLQEHAAPGSPLLLYPVWNGDEALPPKGTVHWQAAALDARTLVLNERFLHQVAAAG